MEVPSPCIDICTLGRGDVCVGCGRHIDEIAVWGGLAPAEKLRVVAASRERLAQLQAQQQQAGS
jgi:predicted Fe-S protein YdhL (DUF1289 family)